MLFYLVGGLIGLIFFKKKYNLTFWQAVWNGIIFSFVLYFGWGLIIGIMSMLVGLDALPVWAMFLYALFAIGGIQKLRALKEHKKDGELGNEVYRSKKYFGNHEISKDPKPGDIIETSVAGVTFEGRQEKIRNLHIGESIKIIREKNNPHDINAIMVVSVNGLHIGYISRKLAEKFPLSWIPI